MIYMIGHYDMYKATHLKKVLWLLSFFVLQANAANDNDSVISRSLDVPITKSSSGFSVYEGKSSALKDQTIQSNSSDTEDADNEFLNRSIATSSLGDYTREMREIAIMLEPLNNRAPTLDDVILFKNKKSDLFDYVNYKLAYRNDIQRHIQLISLAGLLAGPEAIDSLIKWGGFFKKHPERLRAVIHALSDLPITPEAEAFVNDVLASEIQDPIVVRAALLYMAWNKVDSAASYISVYSVPSSKNNYQYLSYYLAAVLNKRSYLPHIVKKFDENLPEYQKYYLLLALSKFLDRQEFFRFMDTLKVNDSSKLSIQRQLKLADTLSISNSESKKTSFVISDTELAEIRVMLSSTYEEEKRLAIDYLLQSGNYKTLSGIINNTELMGVMMYHHLEFNGVDPSVLDIADSKDTKIDLVPSLDGEFNSYIKPLAIILLLLFIMGLLFVKFKRKNQVYGS